MECVCLGDVYEEEVEELVDCANLNDPVSGGYDRNYELFKTLNLGGLYEFMRSLAKLLRFSYVSTNRPTKLEHDSKVREVLKSAKNMFSHKRRKLTFNLTQPGSMNARKSVLSNMDDLVSCNPNFDFLVDDRHVTVVSVYEGKNLRVTMIPTLPDLGLKGLRNGNELEFENRNKYPFKTFVMVTGRESCVTTLCVNDSFGFWFELFAGFSDKAVAFFRVNTNVGLMKGTEEPGYSCANVSDFMYLDEVPNFSKFSPNREMVLVGTKSSLYMLERSGFDLEYKKFCEFKNESLVCADFLNDFEVLVLENNYILTVYKKYDLKFNKFIRYNMMSLVSQPGGSSVTGLNPNVQLNANRSKKKEEERKHGKFVRDFSGNVYLLIKNVNLVKLTWNESLIPYSNSVTFQTPSNLNNTTTDTFTRGVQRLIYNFNAENNMVAVTFRGSEWVHLYSLASFKELHQLKPPKLDYLPKFVTSRTNNNCCYLLVMWSHKSNLKSCLDENYQELFERNLHNRDILRTYKIKSTLTKTLKEPEGQMSYYSSYKGGYDAYNANFMNYGDSRYRQLPVSSSFHPKLNTSFQTRLGDFNKFEDAFGSRRNLFGRSLSDHSLRAPRETIYSIDEFIRNRRR